MMPCDDCGSRDSHYSEKFKTILCSSCELAREMDEPLGFFWFTGILMDFSKDMGIAAFLLSLPATLFADLVIFPFQAIERMKDRARSKS